MLYEMRALQHYNPHFLFGQMFSNSESNDLKNFEKNHQCRFFLMAIYHFFLILKNLHWRFFKKFSK
jgi:hypothetical protein